jgi:hypothetical protein
MELLGSSEMVNGWDGLWDGLDHRVDMEAFMHVRAMFNRYVVG